jgi:hypothetical protein
MEVLALVLSCLALVLSVVGLGLARSTAGRLREPLPIEPKPICGCEHHASFHDEEGCHFIDTDRFGREAPVCGCKKYMGPEPLPEAYLP